AGDSSSSGELGVELNVLLAETNAEGHTYDGVDWGAERVVQEINDRVSAIESPNASPRKKVTRFSIIGYSLGGLLSRYAVGILSSTGFFDKITPVNFATVATPHVGLVSYPTLFYTLAEALGPILLSRTGQHFYARDDWKDGKPLLEVMSEKGKCFDTRMIATFSFTRLGIGGVFYDALLKFNHVTFYANAVNDLTVPFVSSAIEPVDVFVADPLKGIEVELDEKYAPIVKSFGPPKEGALSISRPPAFLTPAWCKYVWNRPSSFPSLLQARFPYNVLIYLLSPLIVPLVLIAILSNFTYNRFHSQKRIRLLESSGKGNKSSIVNLMRTLEKGVEDAIVDMLDDDSVGDNQPRPGEGSSNVTTPTRSPSMTPFHRGSSTPSISTNGRNTPIRDLYLDAPIYKSRMLSKQSTKGTVTTVTYSPLTDPHSPYGRNYPSDTNTNLQNQPILTPAQERIIVNLNTLPGLKKEFVFLDGVRNSHATIVSRDLKHFDFHKRGEGVLRHLADHFEL
ncbi:hypothetical protein FRB99_001224, partial [Tulasnella sp. 403]